MNKIKANKIIIFILVLLGLFAANWANAAADLDINTPAINALKASMQARHSQLGPHFSSGAIGLTQDGLIAVHDATAVPLKDRQGINGLVAEENADRSKLYKEIANANKHPEWEGSIRDSFAGRWIDKAQSGWWYQGAGGWAKK